VLQSIHTALSLSLSFLLCSLPTQTTLPLCPDNPNQGGTVLQFYNTDGEYLFRQEGYFHYLWGVNEDGLWGALDVRNVSGCVVLIYLLRGVAYCQEGPCTRAHGCRCHSRQCWVNSHRVQAAHMKAVEGQAGHDLSQHDCSSGFNSCPSQHSHPSLYALTCVCTALALVVLGMLQGRSYLFIPQQDASYAIWCGPVHGPDYYKVSCRGATGQHIIARSHVQVTRLHHAMLPCCLCMVDLSQL
jgi:hypothetical protein